MESAQKFCILQAGDCGREKVPARNGSPRFGGGWVLPAKEVCVKPREAVEGLHLGEAGPGPEREVRVPGHGGCHGMQKFPKVGTGRLQGGSSRCEEKGKGCPAGWKHFESKAWSLKFVGYLQLPRRHRQAGGEVAPPAGRSISLAANPGRRQSHGQVCRTPTWRG